MKRLKDGTECLLGLGANLPFDAMAPEETIRCAIEAISSDALAEVKISQFYRSTPVPYTDQPDFVNCVIGGKTTLSPNELMSLCQSIEAQFGRQRDGRWQARTLDIDVLAYGDDVLPSISSWHQLMEEGREGKVMANLIVPHPRLHERAFVLKPLADIRPEWVHPVFKKTGLELLCSLSAQQVEEVRPFFAE